MRRPLIAANWKMNAAPSGAFDADSPYRGTSSVDAWVFASFLDVRACTEAKVIAGGQYGRTEPNGAFTGDVSMHLLKQAGCHAVLCGHSERRAHHGETDAMVAAQAIAALETGLHPVVCVGETLEERQAGHAKSVVKKQLHALPLDSDLTIAYEPVWAIGTGVTASPEEAQEMHSYIRSLLPAEKRESTRILYGGSLKPASAPELLKQPDIDGGLVGGASLEPKAFAELVAMAATAKQA